MIRTKKTWVGRDKNVCRSMKTGIERGLFSVRPTHDLHSSSPSSTPDFPVLFTFFPKSTYALPTIYLWSIRSLQDLLALYSHSTEVLVTFYQRSSSSINCVYKLTYLHMSSVFVISAQYYHQSFNFSIRMFALWYIIFIAFSENTIICNNKFLSYDHKSARDHKTIPTNTIHHYPL